MRLSTLRQATTRDICEGVDLGMQEKFGYLAMMLAKQGKDPEPIVNHVRALVDPKHAEKEGNKAIFKNWVQAARPNEEKPIQLYGRKVKVTVLESVARDLITEGIFSGLGKSILTKLQSILSDEEPQEHEMVGHALDEYPELAWIVRYAKKADKSLADDQAFWEKVDRTTNGAGEEIKKWVLGTYKRSKSVNEGVSRHFMLTECVIEEARISKVLQSLGLQPDEVKGVLTNYEIKDDDYDLARLRDVWNKVGGQVKKAVDYVKQLPGQFTDEMTGTSAKGREIMAAKQKEQTASAAVPEDNKEFADAVVLAAALILKSKQEVQQGAKPEEAVQNATAELKAGSESDLSEVSAPSREDI